MMLRTDQAHPFRRAALRLALGLASAAAPCGFPAAAAAQQATIQGIVTSSSTGSPLDGVAVILQVPGQEDRGAYTDRNGFYQIGGIAPGTYTLRGRLIGYEEYQQLVTFAPEAGLRVSFQLRQRPVELEGIVVSAPRAGVAIREQGRQVVTPADLRMVPVPAGSGDLATYLQTLPGVTTTGDRGGQVFVRGGTPAENMVLIDGIPIYQPFHILGFFSVFPEDLVASADFYAGGFGARYHDRTSSVLDVRMRDGNPNGFRTVASASPFVAEALVEGPGAGFTWLASARRSLVEETSGTLLGTTQPLTFESQLLKLTSTNKEGERCAALALRTSDRGRLDPEEKQSHVAWKNLLAGLRCVTQLERLPRLLEVNFNYTSTSSEAVSRGSSRLRSSIWRAQHDVHTTSMLASVPVHAGYQLYLEGMNYDLAELYGGQSNDDDGIFGAAAYVEAELTPGERIDLRPGVVLTASPRAGVEPRLRASWQPFGRESEKLQAAFGIFRQDLMGTSDLRDVSSVFVAWMSAPDGVPLEALHAILGWQQSLDMGLRWSIEGYYKQLQEIPVPVWRGVAQFTTELGRADGEVYGADTRVEYTSRRFNGFVGYGYSRTEYRASQTEFSTWFGQPVQSYHPPHDRRHQVNAVANLDIGSFRASARWQFGSGLPFTRPLGFDEGFDYTKNLHDVHLNPGSTRLVLDRPYTARLPMMHRLDLSLERGFDLSVGRLLLQAGVVNAYDRRNMFYYDLFTGRRADQLPFAPYASITLRGRQPAATATP